MNSRKRSGRLLLPTLLALALFVSGCAGGSDDADANNNAGTGNDKVATGGEEFADADAETAKLGSDAAPGEFPRTVTHSMGETEIQEKPERVVVLDTGELDDVLTLGIMPVGLVTTEGADPIAPYLADQAEGIESVGTVNSLNLEKIAELQPDLILGSQLRADKLYEQLSQIAPTVFSIRPGFPWKENFTLVADALGEEEGAEAALADYDAKVEEVKAAIDGDPTVSLVRWMPDKLRIYGDKSFIGVILNDIGLARPDNQQIDELAIEISPENIAEADADYIFYSSYGDPDATGETQVIEGAGWKALDGVKNGKAFRVDDGVWFLGLGPTGADLVLDQLKDYLSK
ncbi:ABC transporter substrate-binding protein [Cumulibacter soli]|uniref:ABC transporter substrate-binding protein n=1 Tax=Cumulibacter soli TaxID=2546344 RepID=UPI001067C4B4|nr:iron-siderophore ABC transporter substrate-binding protein [Cumulibacter soli]